MSAQLGNKKYAKLLVFGCAPLAGKNELALLRGFTPNRRAGLNIHRQMPHPRGV